MTIYLIGSLRNPEIPRIANAIRKDGHDVFDDWFSPGPHADEEWKTYEQGRGHSFLDALQGHAAKHIFEFDKHHLEQANAVVLVAPAGKSGHLELGWALGKEKPGYILLDSPDRWDIMYQFATGIFDRLDALKTELRKQQMIQEGR